jgi:hypothetical protein
MEILSRRYAALRVRAPAGMRRRRALGAGSGTARVGRAPSGAPSDPDCVCLPGSFCLPRKEVIQPHLPVRLPCYDFTPLAPHAFGASAPRGFGRRLRVQTTRVV